MSRVGVSKVKGFISRATDRFRPPYGKRLIESPRQCVFAGSVNHTAYLRDETGRAASGLSPASAFSFKQRDRGLCGRRRLPDTAQAVVARHSGTY